MLRSKETLQNLCRNRNFYGGIDKLFKEEYNSAVKELVSFSGDQSLLWKKLGEVQYLHNLVKEIQSYGDE